MSISAEAGCDDQASTTAPPATPTTSPARDGPSPPARDGRSPPAGDGRHRRHRHRRGKSLTLSILMRNCVLI